MFYSNTLNLIQVGGGTQVKQGDLGSKFSYKLANEKDQELDGFDKEVAHINLVLVDKIVFTTTATVDNSTVTFNIDKAIPVGLYFLEIKIRDYIFPSDKQTIIFVQSGAVAYDLKDLVPNHDVNMTLKGILSDLSQKGIDISDLKRQLAQKANKDEVTNVMTPKGTLAYASLPTSGNQVGWYYYCPDGDGTHGSGNYVWNGTSWFFGGTGDEGYNLLKEDLVNLDNVIFSKIPALTYDVIGNDFPNNGYINNQGTVPSSTDTNWKNTEFVEVEEGDRIEGRLALGLTDVVCSVACYDINKTFMLDDSLLRMLDGEYIVPEGVHYVRFCHGSAYSSDNFVKIYSKINKNNLKTIKNKVNLICIGDSYGIQNTDGDIEKFYWEYLRDGLGLEEGTDFFHKYRIGAGIGNGGYLEQIQLLDNSVADKESITDILLCGGWNDSNTQNTGGTDTEFWNGAETFFAYIKEKYPNARVSIGHISWGRLGEGMRDQLNLSLARYKEMANKYGCRFLTNMESVLHIYPTEYWQSDSAHPNNEGHKLLGRHIVSAFISGSADVLYDSEISDFVTWGQALETIGKIYSEVNNNITRVWSASENGLIAINGFTNNGITPNGATEYGIAKITTKYFRGYRHHTFATTGCIILANGKYYHGSVRLRFDGDRVYARFYVPHDGLNNWLGNLTNIYIQDFDLSVATMKS